MINFCQAGEVGTLADENAVPALVGQVEVALYRTCLWRIASSHPLAFPSYYAFCEAQSGRPFHPV
jgi:hypothetical protein